MCERQVCRIACVHDAIHLLDVSITKSKIVRTIAKWSELAVVSGHPTEARVEPCSWGSGVSLRSQARRFEFRDEVRRRTPAMNSLPMKRW